MISMRIGIAQRFSTPSLRTIPFIGGCALTLCATAPTHRALAVPNPSLPEDARIVGGEAVEHCAWPSAAMVVLHDPNAPKDKSTRLCTASLVHPEIVITAAHCLDNQHQVRGVAFTDRYKTLFDDKDKKLFHEVETCKAHPKWVNDKTTQGRNLDFAYCKLKKPRTDVPIIPPLMGCEVEMLKAGTPITLVGYGQKSGAKGSAPGDKMQVQTTFNGYSTGGEALVGSQGKGSCYGDSGGPAYVNLKDKFGKNAGWRVFGVTSSGPSGCPGPANYGMIHKFIAFVEKDTKIDVTPCFDAEGNWDPNEQCKAAPLNPRQSQGSWLEQTCEHGPKGGWISTCGDPAGDDDGSNGDDEKDPKDSESSTGDDGGGSTGDGGDEGPKDNTEDTAGEDADNEGGSDSSDGESADDDTTSEDAEPKKKKKKSKEKNNAAAKKPEKNGGCSMNRRGDSGSGLAFLTLGLLAGWVRRKARAEAQSPSSPTVAYGTSGPTFNGL